jgi:assimilatory nitrate reductase catalytic subunit
VRLSSRRGSGCFTIKITPSIREDTVFVPFHWGGEQSINRLTNPALDPVSRMPEFKVCAVRAEAPTPAGRGIQAEPHRAGAAEAPPLRHGSE